jgi:hypothetical protein
MNRSLAGLLMLLALAGSARAEERKFDAAALAKAVAPFLEDGTFLVAHVDLTRVDPAQLAARAAAVTGGAARDFSSMASEKDRERLKALRTAGARDVFLVLAIADLFSKGAAIIVPVEEGAHGKAILEAMGAKYDKAVEMGGAILTGEPSTVERLRRKKGVARPEVAAALTAAGDGVAQVALLLPKDLRKFLEELMPKLPKELGGGRMKTFTEGFLWAGLGIEADPAMRLQLVIASPDADAAKELRAAIDRALQAAAASKELRAVLPKAEDFVPRILPKADGDRLRLALDEKTLGEIVQPLVPKVRGAADRTRSTNNLKQLVLAMHNYHDTYNRFPAAATYSAAGKPLLSWRVHLLPFLDQAELYKQFKLDEPWNSDHNKKLVTKMPRVFDSTGNRKLADEGMTTYLAPRGKETMFPPEKEGLRIRDVLDGTSNTIFLIDADDSRAVPWTKPEDLEVDLSDPMKDLSLRFESGILMAFVDGSVRFLQKKIDKATLKALFTRAGGEVVGDN